MANGSDVIAVHNVLIAVHNVLITATLRTQHHSGLVSGPVCIPRTLQNDLWLLQGVVSEEDILSCSVRWFSYLHLHGIIMYIAWGLLLPLGALMGRYYRRGWPVWFVVHVLCQVSKNTSVM